MKIARNSSTPSYVQVAENVKLQILGGLGCRPQHLLHSGMEECCVDFDPLKFGAVHGALREEGSGTEGGQYIIAAETGTEVGE